ncbi:Hypothetical predicted protein [Octopus vulgaris]|uniref:Uncharacterized protein n=1 Tax=Octopus vulgaris TaxID=6645 RepID=A0AA36ATJ4_OCTVU|nr:Hypothetical predicted protein [Octopus vulgaris]
MTEQKEVKRLMEEYKWYEVGETRYAVIEKKNIGEFMGKCERENWEVKDIRMSDEFVENMEEYFGVRMDMDGLRIGKEHSSDYEKQRTEQKEVKRLMEEYKWYEVGETRYAVIEKNIDEFMVRCERENWESKDIRMSDEFVENMEEYFGVRMDMDGLRIGKEHSSDGENQRTASSQIAEKLQYKLSKYHGKQLRDCGTYYQSAGEERGQSELNCDVDLLDALLGDHKE